MIPSYENYGLILCNNFGRQEHMRKTIKVLLSLFTAEVTFTDGPHITYDYKINGDSFIQVDPTFPKDNY